MDLSRPSAAAACRHFSFAAVIGTLLVTGAFAQQADERQLAPQATPSNGQPFAQRSPLLAQGAGGFEVPPLVERPLGLEEGPRVRVNRFELTMAIDRPSLGISLVEIDGILRGHQTAQPPNGYTVNQLQAVADDVTRYYRERGLILAQAFVPAQEVRDGVVQIGVIEGTLGDISVEGNSMYRTPAVSSPFERLRGRPVTESEIEEALLTLQEFPGLTVFGTFRSGAQLGETDLLVRVTDEDRFRITPMVDNYGSDYTGATRLSVQFDVNNPFNGRDRISGYGLKTYDPDNGNYGGLNYDVRTARGKSSFGIGVARNTFNVTDSASSVDLGIRGEVDQANVYMRRNFATSRTFRASGTFDIALREATTEQPGVDPVDDLINFSFTYDFFATGRQRRAINLGYVRGLYGDNDSLTSGRLLPDRTPVTGSYSKLDYSYQRLQRLGDNQSLLLRMNGQFSSDPLVPLEQYAIGGPANVRAYPVAEALIDSGGAMSLEWIINAPGFADRPAGTSRNGQGRNWGDIFQFSVFYDFADGKLNDPLPLQNKDVRFKGYGIGLQLSQSDAFYVRLDAAKPDGGPIPSDNEDIQYYLSFSLSF